MDQKFLEIVREIVFKNGSPKFIQQQVPQPAQNNQNGTTDTKITSILLCLLSIQISLESHVRTRPFACERKLYWTGINITDVQPSYSYKDIFMQLHTIFRRSCRRHEVLLGWKTLPPLTLLILTSKPCGSSTLAQGFVAQSAIVVVVSQHNLLRKKEKENVLR